MIALQRMNIKVNKNQRHSDESAHMLCPVCGEKLIQEKCKVICRSKMCIYRIIYNCSEF